MFCRLLLFAAAFIDDVCMWLIIIRRVLFNAIPFRCFVDDVGMGLAIVSYLFNVISPRCFG